MKFELVFQCFHNPPPDPPPPQVIHKKMTSSQNTANLGYYANCVDSTVANRQISGHQLQIMFKTDFTHLILLRVTHLIS